MSGGGGSRDRGGSRVRAVPHANKDDTYMTP